MSTYCRTLTKTLQHNSLDIEDAEDGCALGNGYDGFAVLVGIRNYHSIVPMMPIREVPGDIIELTGERTSDKYGNLFGGYYPKTWFTVEELLAFDLDQPLRFLEDRGKRDIPVHRLDDVKEGDTYRSFIERETSLLEWFDKLTLNNIELVCLAFD